MLTKAGGPVVIGSQTLDALAAIRREGLLPKLYGQVTISRSNVEANRAAGEGGRPRWPEQGWPWLVVMDDHPGQQLPSRVAHADPLDAATLRLALGIGASLVLLEGGAKDRAKLSSIKCEGTVSILVSAYRMGHLTAVKPMAKALEKLGYSHVLPGPEMLDAMWKALGELG